MTTADRDHPPEFRLVPYAPESGLTDFQKRVLARLSYDFPRRASDLGLGDGRGVGSSIAALIQRGYASGEGKTGYTRNRQITPQMRKIRLVYQCDRCRRRYYPGELTPDLRSHPAPLPWDGTARIIDANRCDGRNTVLFAVDLDY